LTGVVTGSFHDLDPNGTASLYKATIDWGDGSPVSPGVVVPNSGAGFDALGTHTYLAAGTFPVTVQVTDAPNRVSSTVGTTFVTITDTGSATTINSFAVISRAAVTGQGLPISAVEGFPFSGPVGTLTVTNGPASPSFFLASIDWGDGSSPTSGSISGGPTNFTIAGTHTYAAFGTYHGLVTVRSAFQGNPVLTTFPITAVVAPDLVVRNTNDSGRNSLRYVIQAVDALGLSTTIRFAIPGPAPYVIRPKTPLDALTVPSIIDASTQPGFAGTPIVQVDGALISAGDGLTLDVPATAHGVLPGAGVRSLSVGDFRNGVGIVIEGRGGDRIESSYVGLGVNGLPAPNLQGVIVLGSSGNTISGNVISGNLSAGVQILDTVNVFDPAVTFPAPPAHATGNAIIGNLIGVNPAQTASLPNQQGVFINDAAANSVGGNVISGNRSIGLQILGDKATGNVVARNVFGADRSGARPIPNQIGAFVYAAPGNSVASNLFRFNSRAALSVWPLSNGPELQSIAFTGAGGSQTGVVLTFTTYLDRSRAQNTANYQLAVMGPGFTPNPVPVLSAVYNNLYRTVTLVLGRAVPSTAMLRLVVVGRGFAGVSDLLGNLLDGVQANPASPGGSNFVGFFQNGRQVNPQA
jgi:parallel beta-helix repeat protein